MADLVAAGRAPLSTASTAASWWTTRDPEQLGRLRAAGAQRARRETSSPGGPCPASPTAATRARASCSCPERGAGVWVEFEEGDLEFPIWVGTYWSRPAARQRAAEAQRRRRLRGGAPCRPARPARSSRRVKGHTMQFEDADGVEMVTIVEAVHGHVITLDGERDHGHRRPVRSRDHAGRRRRDGHRRRQRRQRGRRWTPAG